MVPEGIVDRRQIGGWIDPGVRRENVDPAMVRDDESRQCVDGRTVGDVRRRREHVEAARAELGGRFVGLCSVEVRDHHTSAFGGEHGCDPKPDAARAAGDDCDLLAQMLHEPRI